MRRFVLAIGASLILTIWTSPAGALDANIARTLRMLAPVDRMEQLCDYQAMKKIREDHKIYRPDRLVANASEPARIHDHTVSAKGGAFRSRRHWYALTYNCTTASDDMSVTSFSYSIGKEIPEDKWARYDLWQ
jgi:Domain of Unknown Function (DUF930)